MRNRYTLALLLAAAATAATNGWAQDVVSGPGEGPATAPVKKEEGAEGAESPLSLEARLTYVTTYYFRGYNSGDDSLLLQPEATVAYEAYSSDELTITPWAFAWANITDESYEGTDYFDELDLGFGAEFAFGRFTVGLEYTYYTSPADNFGDIEEVGASLSYDDSEQLGLPIALNPYVAIYQEIRNEDEVEGASGELGVKPEFTFDQYPEFSIGTPVALGVNVNNFYFDEDGDETFLGYASVGLVGTYELSDNWSISAGVQYFNLIADSTQETNGGRSSDLIGIAAVAWTY